MKYDAFISYGGRDKPFAKMLATELKSRSLRVWFDEWELKAGSVFSRELEKALLESKTVILVVGPTGLGAWQEQEVESFLYQFVKQRDRLLIPILAPGASFDHVPAFLRQYQFLDLRHDKTVALERLVTLLERHQERIPPKAPPPKVFLCHAKEDEARIERLYFSLRNRGLDPWYDKEKLTVGDDWEQEILQAIEQSDFFAVFLSNISCAKTGFIQKEIRTAVKEYQKRPHGLPYLLPIRLEDCKVPRVKLDDNKELPDLQWADVFADDERAVDRLATAILKQWGKRLERQ